ncbi:LysR family transcriptional regulator [Bordetella sp. BOR01]|uniref:LysR family transcriptional regulator n=1 Tax=Bordetella sp. BOR01 TaxID=2854779 RepID=UPI001C443D37|nr:LysR family transcriptional regulator [Bordetella sp. BOR01]MBV7483838.1 LysR family transcriptional regulator [Bordetella sp. BOR01]
MPKQIPEAFSLIYSKSLETFFAVCQQRSFTKAGDAIGLSQSAVSQSILRLEEMLGVTLFERNVRPIELTPEARVLKEQIEAHAAEVAGTISRIREENALKPIVRAAVIESLSPNIAPSLVRSLARQSNRISILTGTSDNIIGGLLQHQVDVIVSSTPFNDIDGLSRYFLFEEPHVLIMPKALTQRQREWTWHDLQYCGLPIIRYLGQTASGSTIETFFRTMRLEFPMRFEADTSRVVFSLVAAGVGWGLTTPLCLLQCADIVSQMDILPAPEPAFSREIYVITRKGENQGLAESVLKICAGELQDSIVEQLVRIAPGCGPNLKIAVENSLGRRAAWVQ